MQNCTFFFLTEFIMPTSELCWHFQINHDVLNVVWKSYESLKQDIMLRKTYEVQNKKIIKITQTTVKFTTNFFVVETKYDIYLLVKRVWVNYKLHNKKCTIINKTRSNQQGSSCILNLFLKRGFTQSRLRDKVIGVVQLCYKNFEYSQELKKIIFSFFVNIYNNFHL